VRDVAREEQLLQGDREAVADAAEFLEGVAAAGAQNLRRGLVEFADGLGRGAVGPHAVDVRALCFENVSRLFEPPGRRFVVEGEPVGPGGAVLCHHRPTSEP